MVGVLALVGCGSTTNINIPAGTRPLDTGAFQRQTEKFLTGDEAVSESLEVDVATADCDEPTSKAVGTTYSCAATGVDGSKWTFGVEITSTNGFTVQTYHKG